jgi:SAM-dependent methyltransferase
MSGSPTARFGNRVADYVRYRPGYPAAVIDALRSTIGLAPDDVIADIGAGTGISTALFLDHGHTVYAVEPNRAMREAAEAALAGRAGFHGIDGTAEATTLPAAAMDVVVAAQAFHWFDPNAARAEFRRVLRGERRVALLWNTRRTHESAFAAAYEALLVAHGTDYAAVRHDRIDRDRLARFFGGPYEYRTLANAQELDLAALRGRLLSTSYAPAAGETGHDAMIAALEEVFRSYARSGTVRMAYDVEVFAGVLR